MFYIKTTGRVFLWLFSFFLLFGKISAQEKFILVNQFGYLPESPKIAIIRSPRIGPDASSMSSYPAPGNEIKVINAQTNEVTFKASPVLISGRNYQGSYYQDQIDPTSGDKVWHFDFSSVTEPGTYFLRDEVNQQESFQFEISADVYKDLLKIAFKNFYFQRFNIAKEMPYCIDPVWSDALCYDQETEALNYMDKNNKNLVRDVSGGWFDAGDLNKYVNFLDMVFRNLLLSYVENPLAWGDDMEIPESGNGIPDILDEIKWGLDWLLKMQNEDGSVLSVVGGSNGASPPSTDKAQRYYGPENTSSTLTFSLVCAYASQIFEKEPQQSLKEFAALLKTRAEKAWDWAEKNPAIKFYNNDNNRQPGSAGLCAGQNETDDIKPIKLRAAVYLFGLTRNDKYGYYIQDHHNEFPMIGWWGTLSEYYTADHEACFYLNTLPNLPSYLKSTTDILRQRMTDRLNNNSFDYSLNCLIDYKTDAYMSYIDDYNWGSNSYKSAIGNCFLQIATSGWVNETSAKTYKDLSMNYIHYICGVNPMQLVYLTNMKNWGAEKYATQFYHTWFGDKTAWDNNPAPGYIPGGPNHYSTNADGSRHFSDNVPHSKCYIDFNTSWSMTEKPNSSWSITENSLGYQAPFIRLLANFVPKKDPVDIPVIEKQNREVLIYPNPVSDEVRITLPDETENAHIQLFDLTGKVIFSTEQSQKTGTYPVAHLNKGIYIVIIKGNDLFASQKIIVK